MDKLITEAKNGDEQAIEQIVAQYKGLIRSYANKFFLVGGDKDDLLQEGMLGLFYAITNYNEDKGSFPSFVKLCVLRQILDVVKFDAGGKNKPLSNSVELSAIQNLPDDSTPLETLIEKEYFAKIMSLIQTKLSQAERQVLTLFANGYSYDDMMRLTGKSYKAIDGALQRARKKLQIYLQQQD
ncbi:MAG: sigma-70 family RNA polymerase sigma factor [Clostridia bacterium]|nr:sigma-70 family RNA polymerase sigma factor [Clostridia bacterium]